MKLKYRSRVLAVTTALTLAAMAASTTAQNSKTPSASSSSKVSAIDKAFLMKVNGANNAERKYVPVVMQRSSNEDVRKFANQMMHDHTQANQDLVRLAASLKVKLPHDVPAEEQAVIDRIAQEKGAAFDATYKHEMIRDHSADVGEFEREISLGSSPQVKAYAQKYLPTIRHHLEMAQSLNTGMGQDSKM